MKKAKIMLTSLVILAVVGGALAFKARQTFTYFTIDGGVCTKQVSLASTITTGTGVDVAVSTASNPSGGCGTLHLTASSNE